MSAAQVLELWHSIRIPVVILIAIVLFSKWITNSPASEQTSPPEQQEKDTKKSKKETINEEKIAQTLREKAAATTLPSYPLAPISAVDLGEQVQQTRASREEYVPAKKQESSKPKRKTSPKRIVGSKGPNKSKNAPKTASVTGEKDFDVVQPIIFFASRTQSTAISAEGLSKALFKNTPSPYPTLSIPTPSNEIDLASFNNSILPAKLLDLEEIELEDYFLSMPSREVDGKRVSYVYILLLPTYDPPEESPCYAFLDHLEDTENDFRVDTGVLKSLGGFSVFGFGDTSEWGSGKFCRDAVKADKWLGRLTGGVRGGDSRRIFPLGMGDVNPQGEVDAEVGLEDWRIHLEEAIREYAVTGSLGEAAGSRGAVESGDEESADEGGEDEEDTKMADLEDLGKTVEKTLEQDEDAQDEQPLLSIDFTTVGKKKKAAKVEEPKEMVPKGGATYTALTKQG